MALIEKHSGKRHGFRVRLEVNVTQSHREDVAWLPEQTGVGYIRQNMRTYQWVLRNQQIIRWFLTMVAPYSRCKTNQIALATQILEHPAESREDLLEMARLADALSKFNVRSIHRRKNHAAMIQESWLP